MGYALKYDLSLPPCEFENFIYELYPNRDSNPPFNVFYGHVGDGNVHFNIVFETKEKLKEE